MRNRRRRQLRLVVKPFSGIQVHLPWNYSEKKALSFINSKRTWLLNNLKGAHEIEQQSQLFFKSKSQPSQEELRNTLIQRLDQLAHIHGFIYNKVSIRNQNTRWGSCSGKNNISLNRILFFLPDHLRDYVLLHELAHTLQKNHGKSFWTSLYNIFGEEKTKQMRRELRSFSFLFYPPPSLESE